MSWKDAALNLADTIEKLQAVVAAADEMADHLEFDIGVIKQDRGLPSDPMEDDERALIAYRAARALLDEKGVG